jgi:hypothetical protein
MIYALRTMAAINRRTGASDGPSAISPATNIGGSFRNRLTLVVPL